MNINSEKLVKWLHELVSYRKAEAVSREEFNNYNWKTASEFNDETNEIQQACKKLAAEESEDACAAKPMTLDEAIQHCKDVAEKAKGCGCAEQHVQLAKWLEELKDVKTRHAYLAADFENYRKRVANESAAAEKRGKNGAVKKLLGIYDDIDRLCQSVARCEDVSDGVKAMKEGCLLVKKQVEQKLAELGASKIEVKAGDAMDVSKMEAIAEHAGDGKTLDDTVYDCIQCGWTCDGEVLRYAKVVVHTSGHASGLG